MSGASLLLLALLPSACATSARPDLDAVLEDVREVVGAPGAILAVRFPDGSVECYASGVADLTTGLPAAVGDAYHLGSVSKTLTAAVVFRLAEEGHLDLEDPLSRFLPEFPRSEEITLRHLLQQTSGLKDFYLYLYFRPDRAEMIEAVTRNWTKDQLIGLAARFGHHFDPGQDWDYSSTNYFLLGVVIERATEMTLAAAYSHYIFDPLGMTSTWLVLHEPPRADMPFTGYLGEVKGWPHSEMFGELGASTVLEHSSVEWGAGGVVSTAADSLRFLDGLFGGELLKASSFERMLETVPAKALGAGGAEYGIPRDVASAYAHGLMRTQRPAYEMLGHGGIFAGHTAGLWYLPASGIQLAVYFNRGFVPQRLLIDRVVEALGPTPSEPSR